MPPSKKAIALQSLSSNLPELTPPSRGKTQGTMFTSFSSYDLRMEFLCTQRKRNKNRKTAGASFSSANVFKQRINQIVFGGLVKVLRVTLYVKGVRTKQVKDRSQWGYVVQNMDGVPSGMHVPPRLWPDYKVYKETTDKSVLSEDQQALVEMVKALAVKYGFELKVIDVAENRFLDKLETRRKRISSFPTLLTDTGLKIEGDITEKRIKSLLAHY
jgi:hypothetical protein